MGRTFRRNAEWDDYKVSDQKKKEKHRRKNRKTHRTVSTEENQGGGR